MNEGIVIVDKPDGMTSHDVVARVRKKFNMKRVGHAGTLDPLATGVLILLLGKATKQFKTFSAYDKAYRATLVLGLQTTSADTHGAVVRKADYSNVTRERVEEVFANYRGTIKQVPPMVSAVKVNGKKLYELARKGIEVERKPREITINRLELETFDPPKVSFYLECSKGTYVRQLAEDIGKELGCGACISGIRRTKVGDFLIKDAVHLEDLNESHIRHWKC